MTPLDGIKIQLPDVEGDPAYMQCAICGGEPDRESDPGAQIVLPDGVISMTTDDDLCLECAVHLWRAMKERYGPQTRQFCLSLLLDYSVTNSAVQFALSGSPGKVQ